jgi:aminopeptidase N
MIYRNDYLPSAYLIDKTYLNFAIKENWTIVKSTIYFYQNPQNPQNYLILDGEDLELVDIKINNKIPNYQLSDNNLQLFDLPQKFILEITTKIYPQKNTQLSGLYKSKSIFCTQCEAEGFRRITYFLDRPDVLSTYEVKIQTYKEFSAILSNGDLINSTKNSAHWHDPHPKPSYLFALVVGDLVKNSDIFTTQEGRIVELNIWCEKHNINKTDFALKSLKNAAIWDENRFNLTYDLDIYNLVAVDDFNSGAMENKGLNIFNSKFVLANSQTATDEDYLDIEAVVGHEYFHNWTGNRITCKSWFELSLKEGLTVFREQEFSSDMRFRALKRISDANYLRTYQFAEDNSKLSHPVRPESYSAIDNFYTLTVYEKGAEVVRMLHTLLGEERFIDGFANYIQTFDGKAVEIEDFVKSITYKSKFNFDNFMLWYSQSGTNQVKIDYQNNIISQNDNRITPIKYAIFEESGNKISEDLLILDTKTNNFDFNKYQNCTFSWNRDFSAPIDLVDNLTNQERLLLIKYDDNDFVRFDNITQLYTKAIFMGDETIFAALDFITQNETNNITLSLLLDLPSENLLHNLVKIIDVKKIHHQREKLKNQIKNQYQDYFISKYNELNSKKYDFNNDEIIKRKLKNIILGYLIDNNYVYLQFQNANCMTDKFASFELLLNTDYKNDVKESFYQQCQNDELVVNKWFSALALSPKTTATDIKKLLKHPNFSIKNPNKVRSLISSFSANFINFHTQEGYDLLVDIIIELNTINHKVAARLTTKFANYAKFADKYKQMQHAAISKISNTPNLSDDIAEITTNILVK